MESFGDGMPPVTSDTMRLVTISVDGMDIGAASDSIFFMVCGNPDSINGGRWCVRHE